MWRHIVKVSQMHAHPNAQQLTQWKLSSDWSRTGGGGGASGGFGRGSTGFGGFLIGFSRE